MGDIVHGDKYGGDRVEGNKVVNVHSAHRERRPPKVILLMGANPDRDLRLDEERRQIDHAVTSARAGDRLAIRTADAVRLHDLQSTLLRHKPAIAHFSGHGTASAGIVVTDDFGEARLVPPNALSDLFRILRDGLQCVVLNACFTEKQAQAIAAHVPCVVGMRSRVRDDAAVRFSTGFYRGIAHGRSIRVSFELGCNELNLHGFTDADKPRLIATGAAAERPVIGG